MLVALRATSHGPARRKDDWSGLCSSGEAEVLPADPVGDDEPCRRRDQERDEVLVVRVCVECGEELFMSLMQCISFKSSHPRGPECESTCQI